MKLLFFKSSLESVRNDIQAALVIRGFDYSVDRFYQLMIQLPQEVRFTSKVILNWISCLLLSDFAGPIVSKQKLSVNGIIRLLLSPNNH